MTRLGWILTAAVLCTLGLVSNAVGCSSDPATGGPGGRCVGKCDSASPLDFEHRWAIDMQKVQMLPKYRDSLRFVAADPTAVLPPALAGAAGVPERIIHASGPPTDGRAMLWGNMQTLNFDHTAHVDDPVNNPIVNIIDAGQEIDPPGYLNIIALKNASRHEQDEIRKYLRNGDILVYFHPEDSDITQFRMHHAAMYYDTGQGPLAISLNGVPFVHHIDNPMSYGPAFNAGPSSTPFQVYRFNPNGAPGAGGRDGAGQYVFPCTDAIRATGGPEACQAGAASFTITDEMATQYGYIARNWALILNDHAPFSNFHNMTWNDQAQRAAVSQTVEQAVDGFALPALIRGETPEVYCAGLVFANLNLAMNRPLNQAAMGDALWTSFMGNEYQFDDRYMDHLIAAGDLVDPTNLPRLGRLLVEPIPASEILDNWLVGYFGRLPRDARAAILGGAADRIAAGFSQLVWAATKDPAGRDADPVVATPARIQLYAQAYASGDQDLLTISASTGSLTVTPGPDGELDLPQMKALELQFVENRYVPPPQYHSLAQQPDSLLSYVATVIHVDLLSPIGTNTGDTGSGIVDEFAQGGPDSSLYTHFLVPNGGRHVQRVFDVGSGPTQIGLGSKVSTRISAADINDVRVILHPAGTFGPLASLYACDRDAACIGDAAGIPLPVTAAMNGGNPVFDDVDVSFQLFTPVAEGGLGCVIEPGGLRTCPAYDWATGTPAAGRLNIDRTYGQWTVTVLDRGTATAAATVSNCAECTTGGAHSNQWYLVLRDDAPTVTPPAADAGVPMAARTYTATGVPVAISDAPNPGQSTCGSDQSSHALADINVPDRFPVASIDVAATISHSYIEDLHIELRHNGTVIKELRACEGGSGDGSLRLSTVVDITPGGFSDGTWSLAVGDYWQADTGQIDAFSVTFR